MRWTHTLSYFLGGAFLANGIPHFVTGSTGHPLQSPFASPPGVGLSPALVNVLWGAFNFAFAYALLAKVGAFDIRRASHAVTAGIGALIAASATALAFGRFYGG
jgi:hypothetical protein